MVQAPSGLPLAEALNRRTLFCKADVNLSHAWSPGGECHRVRSLKTLGHVRA